LILSINQGKSVRYLMVTFTVHRYPLSKRGDIFLEQPIV
jgi:hypothetical protein